MGSLKDLIYDFSDIILGFFIVAAIVIIVWWKISDTMTISDRDSMSAAIGTSQSSGAASQPAGTTGAKPAGDGSVLSDMQGIIGEDVSITVESGASGYSIGKQLTQAGLITSTTDFIAKVEDMKAASDLRAGEFTFKKGMTLEEIIKVLTGK
jgi:hypothetical protein